MHRIWMLFDPRRTLIALFAFLFTLAVVIHGILLGTRRYHWIDAARANPAPLAPIASANRGFAPGAAGVGGAPQVAPEVAAQQPLAPAGTQGAVASQPGAPVPTTAPPPAAAAAAAAAGAQAIREAAARAGTGGRLAITGYTDATGNLAANQELAKNRAVAVRNALVAAGVAANRIEMRPPASVEANAAGDARAARRVEITAVP
jgi:cytochrome c oxidase subunit 2